MSNELLDLDTLGKKVVLQSTWLFNCLLGGGKNPEGRYTSNSAPWSQYTQVLGNGQDCSTLPTIAITSGSHCGHWCLETDEIKNIKKKVENAFNDDQVLGVKNAFKSACSCYYFRVIHRLVFELQITASVSDLH